VLGEAPVKFINLFNPMLTVLFCVGYLYWTSPVYGLLITILIAVLIGAYLLEIKKNVRKYQYVHELNVNYHSYLSDLLLGFKDLKMSSIKSENIYSHNIVKNRTNSESIITRLRTNNYNSNLVTSYVWYLLLGVVLFVFPKFNQLNLPNTSSFIIILIYIIAPVSTIVGIFPFYSQLKAAAKELDSINTILSEHEFGRVQNKIPNLPEFSRIQFKDVCFEYFDEMQGKTFSLEPLNVEFCSGQVVFIVGGNGSGKSTFLNLFAGLYKPTSGSILFNEQSIDDDLYTEYRGKIAPVFYDGYLLNHNYESFDLTDKNEQLVRYLNLMKLTAVVTPGSIFNSKDRLSKGQQKRLALILALLMERKILILDEWASEQDPAFKDYFYKTVIPYLREEGRTIIAITHDDEYFSCADRVIKFTDGRVVYDHDMSQVTAQ
jgi:cyclic peptide transporter